MKISALSWMAHRACALLAIMAFATGSVPASAQPSPQLPDFTYQGRLTQGSAPANGDFDFTFRLFDEAEGGQQVGPTLAEEDFPVNDGLFTVALAFPGAFSGTQMWLQVSVEGIDLLPRQAVSTAPVAQFALSGTIGGAAGGHLAGVYPDPVIADNVVTSAHLATDAVGASEIQDDSIDGGEIIDNSIGADDIASGAVITAKLANDAVTMAKMAGGGSTGAVSLTLAAGACADGTVGTPGAQPGDLVVFSWGANAVVPARLVVTALRASAANVVIIRACNHGAASAAVTDQPIHLRAFR